MINIHFYWIKVNTSIVYNQCFIYRSLFYISL
uniref:Uncharacterized protein n=1 Tax=Myoviridae sp. ctBrv3 TaxID=2825047 RepID=A0A8S5PCR6_9CAUD|nr:MAG TPA: hypothetical protein [Myoviridae sp. ctBrv3]DAN29975.1 MAG TPA: hypothetical protein [Caudoviricetes sp.]DAR86211.1 MAG TPA: hypothetical protein [Caudoviricetes sp.]